jgi:hypothetical protein
MIPINSSQLRNQITGFKSYNSKQRSRPHGIRRERELVKSTRTPLGTWPREAAKCESQKRAAANIC